MLDTRSVAKSPTPPSVEPVATNNQSTNGVTGNGAAAADVRPLLAPVDPGLRLVEAKLKAVDSSVFAPLAEAFVDLIGSGGKRLRPALAFMAAGYNSNGAPLWADARIVALASSVEMLHTATLVHDDVIDNALLRRGAPTLNASWSKGATVLAGNYMFGRAARFAAETRNMRVIHIFSDTLQIIVNGELRQLFARNDYAQDKASYYQRIYAKTASLFCAATEGAAVLTDLADPQVAALRDYGYNLGMAFQIVDDILDFTGDDATLGKPAGSDLRQGTLTLPFFYFLQLQPDPALLVDDLVACHEQAEEEDVALWDAKVREVVLALRASRAIDDAQQEARRFLDLARRDLDAFPNNIYKQSMLGLCDFVLQRTY
ncbi:MAG: polyprenyl synthetase family protein [Caldilineaceae bacterium]